jgi:L-alanine-DL-glutamate epimerase-like enolase superfamily enzyme
MRPCGITWLEEPFVSGAVSAYGELRRRAPDIPLAGGEGSHDFSMAQLLIDYGGISYVQIDAGRVGGITTARAIAEYVRSRDVVFVNHTFTSKLALSASLQPYTDLEESDLVEYPIEVKPLCRDLTEDTLEPGDDGYLRAPDTAGLGVTLRWDTIREYLKEVEIHVDGTLLYKTPEIPV